MLFVVCFSFDQQEKNKEPETGSFELLIEAKSADEAAEAAKPYLTGLVQAKKRDAFGGQVKVFLHDIFELSPPLSMPALINFRVHPADGFSEIMNPFLDGPAEVTPYHWEEPNNGEREEPFMTFEPAPMRVRMEGAKHSKPVTRGEVTTSSKTARPAATSKPSADPKAPRGPKSKTATPKAAAKSKRAAVSKH